MGFFEPQRASAVEVRREPWAGTYDDTQGGVVPLSLVLARREEVAVLVTRLIAYPAGFSFDVICVSRSWRPSGARQPWPVPGRDASDPGSSGSACGSQTVPP